MLVEQLGGKLSEKRKQFVQEYLVDFNGAQAAIRSGYAPGSAKVTACRLLTVANVKRYLDALLAENRENLHRGGGEYVNELQCIAYANIENYLDTSEGDGMRFRSLESLTPEERIPIDTIVHKGDQITQIVLKDKVRALGMLLKMHGVLDA